MKIKLLLAFFIAVFVGLSGCGKSEEPAQQGTAADTGAVQEQGTSAGEAMENTGGEASGSKEEN